MLELSSKREVLDMGELKDNNAIQFFPRATSQVAMLAWIFGDCREDQIPRRSAILQV